MIENNIIAPKTQDTINIISDAIVKLLEPMQEGEKSTMGWIIEKIEDTTGIDHSTVNSLVPVILRSYPGVEVASGRNGGVFKGKRPNNTHVDTRPRCDSCHQVLRAKPITSENFKE